MPSTPSASASGNLLLYAHPFSSYCQKVLVALYENGTPFEWRLLSQEHPRVLEEFAALWPIGRFPVLVDAGCTIVEASTIIEYLGLHHPGPVPLLPADPRAAPEDRKSVGSGKRVSVRVDLCGRRFIKKKRYTTNKTS